MPRRQAHPPRLTPLSSAEPARGRASSSGAAWLTAAFAAFVASLGIVGADALWAVPLGHEVAQGRLPGSIPFAAAVTAGWHDVPAGAELVLWSLYHALGGYRGLFVAQVAAAAAGFGALAAGLRAEATEATVLVVSAIVLLGSLPAVVVVGVSGASLAFFPLLAWVLERDARTADGRVWLAVPLLAVWGNLHGGVLAGWALLACYAVLGRARRGAGEALALVAAATLALFLNPALWRTPSYYRHVFGSEVARRGTDLWSPLGTGGFDVLLVAAAAALMALALLRGVRMRLWEAAALLGLAAATVHVARTGVFLLFLAAYPAARGLRLRALQPGLLRAAAAAFAAGAVFSVAFGRHAPGSSELAAVAARTRAPVLATPVLGQQVAEAGGRVWVGNPIDAFRRGDQRLYLDWTSGRSGGADAVRHAAYVLVARGSAAGAAAAADARLSLVRQDAAALLYRVRGS